MEWPIAIPGVEYYYVDDYAAIIHGDSLEILPSIPDNAFDLCLTDPPYGTGNGNNGNRGGKEYGKAFAPSIQYIPFDDIRPDESVIAHCLRVSKNQIIFGGNFWSLPISKGWIFWDKVTGANKYGDGELAWTSLDQAIRLIRHQWAGAFKKFRDEKRQHPTQKPLSVIRQCLEMAPGETVIDPFMGSGTTLEAAKSLNRRCIGIELSEEYCAIAVQRLQQEVFAF